MPITGIFKIEDIFLANFAGIFSKIKQKQPISCNIFASFKSLSASLFSLALTE